MERRGPKRQRPMPSGEVHRLFSCTITTNAQLPFDGTVADSIWVSMDGVGEAHERIRGKGTFERLEKNVATCGCKNLSANMAINSINYDSVGAAIEYVASNPAFKCISLNFHTPFQGQNRWNCLMTRG